MLRCLYMLLPLMSLPLWQSGFLCSRRPVLQWPDKCQRFPGPNPPAPWECACWSDPDCELSWWYPKGTERDDNIIKHLIPLLISLGNKMMFPQQCLSTFFKNSFYFYYWLWWKDILRLYNQRNLFSFFSFFTCRYR